MSSVLIHSSNPKFDQSILFELEANVHKIINYLVPTWLKFWEITIFITSDSEIKTINSIRRNFNKATDVLSFPMIDWGLKLPQQILGEVYISWDTVITQALEVENSNHDEFYRLLVHGILHIFGYDHMTSASDEIKMKAKEDEILKIILGDGIWD
jgi:probable rRNA maturation factor